EGRGRRPGKVDGAGQGGRRLGVVLPGDGPLATGQEGRGPSAVRPGRRLGRQTRPEGRGVAPLPRRGRGAAGPQGTLTAPGGSARGALPPLRLSAASVGSPRPGVSP